MIHRVRKALGLPIAIMLDTKGPEYRICTFKNKKILLQDGDAFTFTTRQVEGDETIVGVSYAGLANDLSVGDTVLVNNGLVIFTVERIEGTEIHCRVVVGGELSDRKSMSFPHKVLEQVYLSEQDKDDLLFGIRNGIDFVAASFVSRRQDVLDVRNFLDANGGQDIEIIAKIENQTGIDNVEEICEVCSGIMIGRGDLGVEVPFAELPAIQKYLITKCRLLGKRVITATEMLESMIHNPRPTRAEISDVANAVYDGTSAVMLSGESAAGKYPVKTVQTMAEIGRGLNFDQALYTDVLYGFGGKLYFIRDENSSCGLYAIDLETDKQELIYDGNFEEAVFYDNKLYFIPWDNHNYGHAFYRLSLTGGEPELLFDIPQAAMQFIALRCYHNTFYLVGRTSKAVWRLGMDGSLTQVASILTGLCQTLSFFDDQLVISVDEPQGTATEDNMLWSLRQPGGTPSIFIDWFRLPGEVRPAE